VFDDVKKTDLFRKNYLIYCIFFLVILLIYGESLFYSFNWDDFSLFKNNERLYSNGLLSSIKLYFFSSDFIWYRPLYLLSFYFDYQIHRFNPIILRLENILIFYLISVFLFKFIYILTKHRKLSFLTTICFIIMPINTETVCFISGRDSALSLLFFLISIFLFYKSFANISTNKLIFYSNIFFLLSMLCKENGVCTLGWVLSLIFFYSKNKKRDLLYFTGYIITFLIYIILRYNSFISPVSSGQQLLLGENGLSQLITIPSLILNYLKIILFPLNLNIFYDFPSHSFNFDVNFFIGFIIILFSIFLLCSLKNPLIKFSICTFYISLAPFMHIINIHHYMTNRWANMATISIVIMIIFLLNKLFKNRYFFRIFFTILLIFYLNISIQQTKIWKDDLTLFSYAIKKNSNFISGFFNLGNIYFNKKEYIESEKFYKKCLELNPCYQPAITNLGYIYLHKKQYNQAYDYFQNSQKISENIYAKHGIKILKKHLNEINKEIN